MRLVEWTPGTAFSYFKEEILFTTLPESRVYDVNVYDEQGNSICAMRRPEAREFPAPPYAVAKKRYELIYQPVGIDVPISPLGEVLAIHDEEILALHQWLDSASQAVISTSLAKNPHIGTEVRSTTSS